VATGPVRASAREVGPYRLILEQAQGPLGSLWIASGSPAGLLELFTLRPVAPQWLVSQADVDALAGAARWAQELEHPHILHTVDVVAAEQQLAVVTEFREGEVLRDLLAYAEAQGRPAPPGVALRMALDLLDALAHLDSAAAGLAEGGRPIHGGLVPDSVLVGADGHTSLLDVATSAVAQSVLALGKHPEVASYLSPEQVLHGQADERSVVFSVGVLMWEMLAGKRLFSDQDYHAVLERVTAGSIRPPEGSGVPQPLADIVTRALERDAVDRYPSSAAMARAIRTALREALGTRTQVAAWLDSLNARGLRERRDSLESTLGVGLGALPPRASRTPGEPLPAAQVPVPTDLTGTAPELPATRRRSGTGGKRARSQTRKAQDAKDQGASTRGAGQTGARAAALLEEEASPPRASRTSEDLLDESDQLPTTLYRDPSSGVQELGPPPGPEVLGEPAPWARQPFFCDQRPPVLPSSSVEATPRAIPGPTWPPKPVRVAPRVATPAAARASTPPAPAVVPDVASVGPVTRTAGQAADPTPPAQTTATPAIGEATPVCAPGPVVAHQTPLAPPPAVARVPRRRAATVALLAGSALACAVALASWLSSGHSETTSTGSPSKAPSASRAPASSRVGPRTTAATAVSSLAPTTSGSDEVDANSSQTQTPEAGAPDASQATESARTAPAAPPSAARAPTPKAPGNPARKFLPTDL
jgi:hypothetical protein